MISLLTELRTILAPLLLPNAVWIRMVSLFYVTIAYWLFSRKTRAQIVPLWSKDIRNMLVHIILFSIVWGTTLGLSLFVNEDAHLFLVCSLSAPVPFILAFYGYVLIQNWSLSAKEKMDKN